MSEQIILVTGAAGGLQGKTGRSVSELLLQQGSHVRAFVRKHDARSDYLKDLGAEIYVGDFLDFQSVEKACKGVQAVYFAYPVQDGVLEATANMAVAARDAGIARLVNVEMLRSSPDAPTFRMRQNYFSEKLLDWADVGAVHVKAAVFYENLYAMVGTTVSETGAIRLPWGDDSTVIPLVSGKDVARVAAQLLLDPNLPSGLHFPIVGAAPALKEIVEMFRSVLGDHVRYESVSDDEWCSEQAVKAGSNSHAIKHLSQLWGFLRMAPRHLVRDQYQLAADTLVRFGGKGPVTLEAFLKERLGDQVRRDLNNAEN